MIVIKFKWNDYFGYTQLHSVRLITNKETIYIKNHLLLQLKDLIHNMSYNAILSKQESKHMQIWVINNLAYDKIYNFLSITNH